MAASAVFLPGKSHGQRSLAGYSPWGHKESHTTEQLSTCVCLCDEKPAEEKRLRGYFFGCTCDMQTLASEACSLESLMLKLKLQYFGLLMRRADSFEKTLML